MAKFYPYNIQHLPLSGIRNIAPPQANSFLVFWWKNLPVGHLWIDTDELGLPFYRFRQMVLDTVTPALNYYIKDSADLDKLSELLLGDDEFALDAALEEAFIKAFNNNAESEAQAVSVVVCTRNRPKAIETCLEALMESSDTNFELIVVDNAPDDDSTRQVVSRFPGVRYVLESRKGLDNARNTGVLSASHSIIAYTDDDVYVDIDWIKNIKECFSDPMTMAVTGLVLPASLNTRSQYIFEKHWGFNRGYLPITFDQKYFQDNLPWGVPVWNIGAGANMAFRKEAFELAGLFDPRLDVGASGCSGDSEMWYRILAEGWNCHYNPKAVVYHQHRSSRKDLNKQIFNYMRGQVSSLMVQYENYGHQGNLDRVQKGLKAYYQKRFNGFLKREPDTQIGTLLTEIRGAFSGWKFYQKHKDQKRQEELRAPYCLRDEVVVNQDTRVSVIIPCYNHGMYLNEAIMSVYRQTYPNMEIIVVDDGSDDDTRDICALYSEVKYVRTARVGLSAARNIGVMFATGSFLMFLDADDILYPNAAELNLFYFKRYPWAAFVSGGHDRIDKDGNIMETRESVQKIGDNYQALLQGNYIGMQATVMYRRELFFAFHFDPKLKACEDYDLNLRIARHFSCASHTNKIAGYRIHDANMSHNKTMMYEMAMTVLKNQEGYIRQQDEKENYSRGLEYWKKYYKADEPNLS
ncbi:MAG: glycosyltransferase [Sphingobacteriales bacterium]|nr:MAG: glycosyltransferase [Sphingobacteriales bacterium]